ncbi:MAG: hypothetical protein J6P16_04515, partial [Eubacterium sp.]|nr:hypothetical protein [Eubacterium sp.]
MNKKTIIIKDTVLSCLLCLAMIFSICGVMPGSTSYTVSDAAASVVALSELPAGSKVSFTGMSGTLNTTWTYCGQVTAGSYTGYYFECDVSIGSYTSEGSISKLTSLESSIPTTLKSKLGTLKEGPKFYTLKAMMYGDSDKDN